MSEVGRESPEELSKYPDIQNTEKTAMENFTSMCTECLKTKAFWTAMPLIAIMGIIMANWIFELDIRIFLGSDIWYLLVIFWILVFGFLGILSFFAYACISSYCTPKTPDGEKNGNYKEPIIMLYFSLLVIAIMFGAFQVSANFMGVNEYWFNKAVTHEETVSRVDDKEITTTVVCYNSFFVKKLVEPTCFTEKKVRTLDISEKVPTEITTGDMTSKEIRILEAGVNIPDGILHYSDWRRNVETLVSNDLVPKVIAEKARIDNMDCFQLYDYYYTTSYPYDVYSAHVIVDKLCDADIYGYCAVCKFLKQIDDTS